MINILYKTHVKFSLLMFIILLFYIVIPNLSIKYILIVMFASLLPDIDCETSFISNRKIIMFFIFAFLFITSDISIYRILILLCWYLLSTILAHRTFSHSIISLIFLYMTFLDTQYSQYIIIGYSSHLLLDMISGGVKLLYPFYKKRIGCYLVKTNSRSEVIFDIFQTLTIIILIFILIIEKKLFTIV